MSYIGQEQVMQVLIISIYLMERGSHFRYNVKYS